MENRDFDPAGWIRTYTGLLVSPMDLRPEMVSILDIAQALSRTCRYGGHVEGFLSVAEHSVEVSKLVPDELKLTALLHDASEAYLGDIPSPIKKLPEMAGWRIGEERAHVAIATFFGTAYPHPEEVERADAEHYYFEVEHMRDFGRGMTPAEAKHYFLDAFHEYTH